MIFTKNMDTQKNKNEKKESDIMSLMNQNNLNDSKFEKNKKIILTLLIITTILIVLIIGLMIYISANKTVEPTLQINGVEKQITEGLFISDTEGNQYIELKNFADAAGYEYYNSGYGSDGVDENKAYIKNGNLITSFEANSSKIYKHNEETNLDYEYYNMKNKTILYNGKMYVSLEDLPNAQNTLYNLQAETNSIKLYTQEYMATAYQKQLTEKGYTVTTDANNQKALAYGYIIVSKGNKWGVLNSEYEEIISAKYTSIQFDELNLNYIVSNENGKFGVITITGEVKHAFKYDNLQLLNYKNMLYTVKYNDKLGILKFDGTMLTDVIYDEIGYKEDEQNKILYTLIIPDLNGKTGETIVVRQNDKYGLIYLKNGKTFIPCDHIEKLYSINKLGEIEYMVEAQGGVDTLNKYIEWREATD